MQRQREFSLLLLHKRTAKPQPCLRSASNAATSRWVHGEGSHALRLLPIRHRRSKRAGRFLALLRLRTPRAPNASASADLSAFAETPAARRLRDNQIRLESPMLTKAFGAHAGDRPLEPTTCRSTSPPAASATPTCTPCATSGAPPATLAFQATRSWGP
jgi:hypothetical protein